jgi:DNA-binding NtrC family response regulator
VGATKATPVDVRLIAASNRNLELEAEQGRFRRDLFWRLNVLTIDVPALRDRVADIPRLAAHFLARAAAEAGSAEPGPGMRVPPAGFAPEAMSLLLAYPWPGNVRELRNAVLRAATLSNGPLIQPDDLPPRIRELGAAGPMIQTALREGLPLAELERMYILQVLRETNGNRSRAAEILGLDRKTLYRRIEEYRERDPGGEW